MRAMSPFFLNFLPQIHLLFDSIHIICYSGSYNPAFQMFQKQQNLMNYLKNKKMLSNYANIQDVEDTCTLICIMYIYITLCSCKQEGRRAPPTVNFSLNKQRTLNGAENAYAVLNQQMNCFCLIADLILRAITMISTFKALSITT